MLSDYIRKENILVELESTEKDVLFAEMTEVLIRLNPELDRKKVLSVIEAREELQNTCVMKGIAVPHGKYESIKNKKPLVCIGISKDGVDYEVCNVGSKDFKESLVHLVFMILFDSGDTEMHLKLLADCARLLRIPGFYEAIVSAGTSSEVISLIQEYETEH